MSRVLIIFLLLGNLAEAQFVTISNNVEKPIIITSGFKLAIPQNKHQYLATKWTKGQLFYNNGTSKLYDSLNFDRYANRLEVVANNKALLLMPMGLSGAMINGASNEGTLLIVGDISGASTFLVVLSVGTNILASYLTPDYIENTRGFKTDEVRFVPKGKEEVVIKEHFTILKQGKWHVFKLNKPSLTKLFKVEKKKLQEMASNEQVSLNDSNGLIKIFQILNKE